VICFARRSAERLMRWRGLQRAPRSRKKSRSTTLRGLAAKARSTGYSRPPPLQALDRRLCLLPAAKAMAMVCVRHAELGGCRSNNERHANHARRVRFMFLGSSRFRARVLLGSGVSRVAIGAYKNHETRPTREIHADDRPVNTGNRNVYAHQTKKPNCS